MKRKGICALCGENKKMSFEHFQPKAAGNSEKAFMKLGHHLFPIKDHVYGKRIVSNKGFGGYTLCERCNNFAGSHYVEAYSDVYNIVNTKIDNKKDGDVLNFNAEIKPLNFLKEVAIIFLSADRSLGTLRRVMSDFVENKQSQLLDSSIKIYMACDLTSVYQAIGLNFCISEYGTYKIAKFSYPPMGFLLSLGTAPVRDYLYDITYFKDYKFDEIGDISFKLKVIDSNISL